MTLDCDSPEVRLKAIFSVDIVMIAPTRAEPNATLT